MTLRVAQIIDTLHAGGAQSLLVTLAESTSPGALQLDIISLNGLPAAGQGGAAARLRAAGATVRSLPGRRLADPRRFARLYRQLRRTPYDLVHTHLTFANILGICAARLAGLPVAASLHNVRPSRQRRATLALEGPALERAGLLIAVGEQVAAAYQARLPGRPIHILPNAVRSPAVLSPAERRALRSALAGDPDRPLLVAAGRLTAQKGYPDLFAAMQQVALAVPDAALVIAGEGELRAPLQAEIAARGLQGQVALLGLRDDVPALFAAADLFVSASLWEGLPVALLEAMAAGLPVVVTAVGDAPQVVAGAANPAGLLISPGCPAGLAQGILTLLRDPERRRLMGAAGAARVAGQYSAAAWSERMLALYAGLVAARRRPAGAGR